MKKFKYKMETLLKLKENLEKQLKIEFKNMNNCLNEEKEKLNKLNLRHNEYEGLLTKSLKDELNMININHNKQAIVFIREKTEKQEEIIKEIENALKNIRIKLIEAIKERKILEKLKDKEYERYKLELKREEEKENDEFISFKYGNSIQK